MERGPDGRLLAATDTCVLINFLRVKRLDLICRHKEYRFVVTEHVKAEITDPLQLAEVEAAIAAGDIEDIVVTEPAELTLFGVLAARLGAGEAAAIAVAASRNWMIATD